MAQVKIDLNDLNVGNYYYITPHRIDMNFVAAIGRVTKVNRARVQSRIFTDTYYNTGDPDSVELQLFSLYDIRRNCFCPVVDEHCVDPNDKYDLVELRKETFKIEELRDFEELQIEYMKKKSPRHNCYTGLINENPLAYISAMKPYYWKYGGVLRSREKQLLTR